MQVARGASTAMCSSKFPRLMHSTTARVLGRSLASPRPSALPRFQPSRLRLQSTATGAEAGASGVSRPTYMFFLISSPRSRSTSLDSIWHSSRYPYPLVLTFTRLAFFLRTSSSHHHRPRLKAPFGGGFFRQQEASHWSLSPVAWRSTTSPRRTRRQGPSSLMTPRRRLSLFAAVAGVQQAFSTRLIPMTTMW